MGPSPHAPTSSLWDRLREFPPIIVRLYARRTVAGKNVDALSGPEIAIASGLPLARIVMIAQSFSFDEVPMGEAERFCHACNFDPTNRRDRHRQLAYLRSCQTNHPGQWPLFLRRSPHWETEFLPLIRMLKSRQTSSPESNRSAFQERNYAA